MSAFEKELTAAGMQFDGHVTNGSLQEQLKVIERWVGVPLPKKAPDPLPDQFWLALGFMAGAALKDSEGAPIVETVYRILTERYPEMWPLKKYLKGE